MKVVTFFNNKGGVGKTTTIINLASYLSIYREKKVLVVWIRSRIQRRQFCQRKFG